MRVLVTPNVNVFGRDCPTADGTGVRDYIHVTVASALEHPGAYTDAAALHCRTGQRRSVLELARAFEKASGRDIAHDVVARRAGDAERFAPTVQVETTLDWSAPGSLAAMCEDTWRWQTANPSGYP